MDKHTHTAIIVLVMLLFGFSSVNATTYYVDPNGLDTNTGGQNDPFKTIQHAIDDANDGTFGNPDIIYVESGEYETGPITFSYDYVTVYFDEGCTVKAELNSFPDLYDCLFEMSNLTGIVLEGDEDDDGIYATLSMDDLVITSGEWRHGIALLSCTTVSINGLNVEDTGGDGIYIRKRFFFR